MVRSISRGGSKFASQVYKYLIECAFLFVATGNINAFFFETAEIDFCARNLLDLQERSCNNVIEALNSIPFILRGHDGL